MDPFSIAASVFATVQIADRVISLCKAYISGVQEAPVELRNILIEVGSVKCVFELIKLLDPKEAGKDGVSILPKLEAPINECQEALKALEELLPSNFEPQSGGQRQRKKQKLDLCLTLLAWPRKREKAQRLLDELGRHKATISLGLTTETQHDSKHIRRTVDEIRTTANDAEKFKILEWLVRTDPSPNHNAALDLRERHTGSWLVNSLEYIAWKDSVSTRLLWLHGIPGAGKTILHSHIVEAIRELCQVSTAPFGWSYYYCYFARSQDETPHLLRWAINQLCRQLDCIPPEVKRLFKQGGDPSIPQLLQALAHVSEFFSRVYIAIDALDESEGENILKCIRNILSDPKMDRVQVVVTSRMQKHIERILSPVTDGLSLSNAYVDADIRTFIATTLNTDMKMSRWSDGLKTEVETALVKGAQGMFRWAFCQIEILKFLHTETDIRLALTNLPRTLDETYERILSQIPHENADLAYRILLLVVGINFDDVAFTGRRDEALCEALAVNPTRFAYEPESRPFSVEDIPELCTSLVTHDPKTGNIKLAHYTVKEFLTSPRILSGPASRFHMTDDSVRYLVALTFIVYMILPERYRHVGLGTLAVGRWISALYSIESKALRASLAPLVLQLFDLDRPETQNWIQDSRMSRGWCCPYISEHRGAQASCPLAYCCYIGFQEGFEQFVETHTDPYMLDQTFEIILESSSLLKILHAPIEHEMRKFMSTFLNSFESVPFGMTLLQIAGYSPGTKEISQLLLATGADINTLSITGNSYFPTYRYVEAGLSAHPLDHLQRSIEFMLSRGARFDECNPAISSIQALVLFICDEVEENDGWLSYEDLEIYTSICKVLIATGADINAVVNDARNVMRLRHTTGWMMESLQMEHMRGQHQEIVECAAISRGHSEFYDTPLRIFDRLANKSVSQYQLKNISRLTD